jgi:hypothetical protein
MKKFLLPLVLMLVGAAFAQTAPKLTTKEPSFIGFTGTFMKFGKVTGNTRPFTMTLDYKPWFFELSGVANAGPSTTEELDYLAESITIVIAYYDAGGKALDGTPYQAGLFDFIMYLDDDPIKVTNMKIALKGKAESGGSSVLNQAKTWNFEQGKVFSVSKYSSAIMKAQASALDKVDIEKEAEAERKRIADSIAIEKKRIADSIAAEKKRIADSIATEKKRIADSIALDKRRAAVLLGREKKWTADSLAREKKRVTDSTAMEKKRIADSTAREKKRITDSTAMEKKRIADISAMEKKWIADSTAKEKKRAADSVALKKQWAADSIASRKQWVADSIASRKKWVADSIAINKKRVADSIELAERKRAAEELAKEEKAKKSQGRKKAVSRRKVATEATEEDWW